MANRSIGLGGWALEWSRVEWELSFNITTPWGSIEGSWFPKDWVGPEGWLKKHGSAGDEEFVAWAIAYENRP